MCGPKIARPRHLNASRASCSTAAIVAMNAVVWDNDALGANFTVGPIPDDLMAKAVEARQDLIDLAGELDHIPEQCFYMAGGIEDVMEAYEKIKVAA